MFNKRRISIAKGKTAFRPLTQKAKDGISKANKGRKTITRSEN